MLLTTPVMSVSSLFQASWTCSAAHGVNEAAAQASSAPLTALSLDPGFQIPGVFQMVAASGPGSFGSISSHVDLLLIGAAVLAAGAGAVAYLMRKKQKADDPTPKDGVPRTESQKQFLLEAIRLEKSLLSADAKARLEAIPPLLDLVRKLAPADRPQRIQRIAQQLCLDWTRITKDPKVGDPIRSRIPRLPAPILKKLMEALKDRSKDRQVVNISANAAAILRWIDGK